MFRADEDMKILPTSATSSEAVGHLTYFSCQIQVCPRIQQHGQNKRFNLKVMAARHLLGFSYYEVYFRGAQDAKQA